MKDYILRQLWAFFNNIVQPALNLKADSIDFDSSTKVLSLKSDNKVLDTATINISSDEKPDSSDIEWKIKNGILYAVYDDGE